MADLADLFEQFIIEEYAGRLNETPAAYRRKVGLFLRWAGPETPAAAFNLDTLNRFLVHLQTRQSKRRGSQTVPGPLSPAYIDSVLRAVLRFARWLAKCGHVAADVTLGFRKPRLPRPNPKAISSETVTALLRAAQNSGAPLERARNLALVYVLRDTGGRARAVANIELGDLQLERGRIRVMEKGAQAQTLHVSKPTAAAIRRWLKERPAAHPRDDRLFTGRYGWGLSYVGVYQVLQRLAKSAGVTARHNPHAFRHAFARDLITNGADISQVSALMGHHSPVVTIAYYARWADDELHAVHARASPVRHLPALRPKAD
jgi:site-specific recombinase XerD